LQCAAQYRRFRQPSQIPCLIPQISCIMRHTGGIISTSSAHSKFRAVHVPLPPHRSSMCEWAPLEQRQHGGLQNGRMHVLPSGVSPSSCIIRCIKEIQGSQYLSKAGLFSKMHKIREQHLYWEFILVKGYMYL